MIEVTQVDREVWTVIVPMGDENVNITVDSVGMLIELVNPKELGVTAHSWRSWGDVADETHGEDRG